MPAAQHVCMGWVELGHAGKRELGQITEVAGMSQVKKSTLHPVDNGKQPKDYN